MMTTEEYNKQVQAWQEKNSDKKEVTQEPTSFQQDDWECEHCKEVNKMDFNDVQSSKCKRCMKRNQNVRLLIEGVNSNKYREAEEREIGAYN